MPKFTDTEIKEARSKFSGIAFADLEPQNNRVNFIIGYLSKSKAKSLSRASNIFLKLEAFYLNPDLTSEALIFANSLDYKKLSRPEKIKFNKVFPNHDKQNPQCSRIDNIPPLNNNIPTSQAVDTFISATLINYHNKPLIQICDNDYSKIKLKELYNSTNCNNKLLLNTITHNAIGWPTNTKSTNIIHDITNMMNNNTIPGGIKLYKGGTKEHQENKLLSKQREIFNKGGAMKLCKLCKRRGSPACSTCKKIKQVWDEFNKEIIIKKIKLIKEHKVCPNHCPYCDSEALKLSPQYPKFICGDCKRFINGQDKFICHVCEEETNMKRQDLKYCCESCGNDYSIYERSGIIKENDLNKPWYL